MTTGAVGESRDGGTLLEGERLVLEMIATGAPLAEVLDMLCRIIDQRSGLMSAVFLVDGNGMRLTQAAGPNLPDMWREATTSVPLTAAAGACGTAVTRREQVIVADVLSDPTYEPFREAARAAGISAAWSTPFFAKDRRVLGTFAVHSFARGLPSAANLELVDRATHLASIAVERSQMEESLRESEERFRQMGAQIREVFWLSSADFSQMLYVSSGYELIWGHSCESLYREPRSWMAAIHPEDRVRVTAIVEAERDRGFEIEYRVVRPDGSIRWIWDRGFPVHDASARLYRVAGIAEDVTERKRVEEQLRTSEHLLAEAQRLAHIGSWSSDLAGRVTWSDELYRIFGLHPGEIDPAHDAMAFIDAADRDLVMRSIEAAFETKEPYSFFYRIHRRDGSERILHSIGYVACNAEGEPVTIFGTTQDVTERRQAEEALRRSEQLLRVVMDTLPVGVVVVDRAGDIILSNPASQRIWGELIGSGRERYARSKAWWYETGEEVAPGQWPSARALAGGETSLNEVIEIEAFDGIRKIIENSAVPIRDTSNRITGAVIVHEDISARKTAERERNESYTQLRTLTARLMRAQDDERRRIAQMLHETTAQDLAALKMLLARLNRTAEGLSDSERGALTESVALAEQAMTEVRTLSYLLYPPFLDETGLLSALRWYAAGFGERSGIHVSLDVPDSFERLSLDAETALFRIVQESLINIHRHAGSESAAIRLRRDADTLVLEIEDRGRGIEDASLAHILSGEGAGVGIAGMRERIEQLGGRLEITSSENGTTVRARLRLAEDAG
jgi:PAS domain S-box-containing protein